MVTEEKKARDAKNTLFQYHHVTMYPYNIYIYILTYLLFYTDSKICVSLAFFFKAKFFYDTGLTHLDNVFIGQRLVGFVVLGIFEKYLVHVRAGVLIEFVARAEDYEGYLAVAEDGKLVSLFHHSEFTFVERNLRF